MSAILSEPRVEVGCYVSWKNDPEFVSNHEPQMSVFFRRYGYGPFLVIAVRHKENSYDFVTISTPQGNLEFSSYYLRLLQSSATPS
jgi:hypothetical protein